MIVSVQVAIYSLWQDRLIPIITAVSRAFDAVGFRSEVGPMSTMVIGDVAIVFRALEEVFVQAGALGHVVMIITVFNVCPVG